MYYQVSYITQCIVYYSSVSRIGSYLCGPDPPTRPSARPTFFFLGVGLAALPALPCAFRLFPDGPSAATQAHAAPVVHPLLMGHMRTTGSGGSRNSVRGSRSSRGGGASGASGASARQLAALGLPNDRLTWEGHVRNTAGLPDQTLRDAIEVRQAGLDLG